MEFAPDSCAGRRKIVLELRADRRASPAHTRNTLEVIFPIIFFFSLFFVHLQEIAAEE
jgi:hypothetical protein